MIQFSSGTPCRQLLWMGLSLGAMLAFQAAASGQDQFRTTPRGRPDQNVPSLSEATAILEAAVRALYQNIEPGSQTTPNELIAYADLRALRLYTGALEVAGWDLEQAAADYAQVNDGRLRGSRGRPTDDRVTAAREKYLAFRETVRTLLFRVRSTAVAAEHQVSFCDRQVNREWQQEVVPALLDTIAATQPMFYEQDSYASYRVPGSATSVIATSSAGIPANAVEVDKNPDYQPYEGRGRGQGRFFEIRAYGGSLRVKKIRFRSHENAFGVIGTSVTRELDVDQVATPSKPLYIPCNRERTVDLSELEIEWESEDGRSRKVFGTIDVVADRP